MKSNCFTVVTNANDAAKSQPNALVFIIEASKTQIDIKKSLANLTKAEQEQIASYAKDSDFKAEAGSTLAFDLDAKRSVFIMVDARDSDTFTKLKRARTLVSSIKERHRQRVLLTSDDTAWVDALLSAIVVANFKPQKFAKAPEKPEKTPEQLSLTLLTTKEQAAAVTKTASESEQTALATNMVRDLTLLPANILDCAGFVERAQKLAKAQGLECVVNDYKKLKQMKAGAFIAVAQGSSHEDSGIVQLSYKAPKSKKRVVLVGKGITFDTGGVNIKTGTYMLGMHGDMMGAAVCLAMVSLAAKEKWPINVDAYLAIADNAIGPDAFRPNEVVTAANKLTIETIHTDAEGRMVLADTLYFASKTKPDLIIDYATLTGSAVRAIGTNYSACFSNKADSFPAAISLA